MKTLQSELTKYRTFLANVRNFNPEILTKTHNAMHKGEFMQQQEHNQTRLTARGSNKRYKRSSEELDHDIEKVDQLVASGKFTQLEALQKVGLQSSVYHYRKRKQKEPPMTTRKPRKFAHRVRAKANGDTFEQRKDKILSQMDETGEGLKKMEKEIFRGRNIEQELVLLRAKYDKLKDYVINQVLND
jgi:hypothetical protein